MSPRWNQRPTDGRFLAERTGLAVRRGRSIEREDLLPPVVAVSWSSPCRMIGRNPFYPNDRIGEVVASWSLVYLPASSPPPPLLLSSFLSSNSSRQEARNLVNIERKIFPSPLVRLFVLLRPSGKVVHKYLMRVMESRLLPFRSRRRLALFFAP